MIMDSELNENCLYGAVIQSNDILRQGMDEELPEWTQELRLLTNAHLRDLRKNPFTFEKRDISTEDGHHDHTTMTQEEIDEYISLTGGEEAPQAGALDICALGEPNAL